MKLEERYENCKRLYQHYKSAASLANLRPDKITHYESQKRSSKEEIDLVEWAGFTDGTLVLKDDLVYPDYIIGNSLFNSVHTDNHKHDYIEIGYIVAGIFQQTIEGQTYRFEAGDVFIIDMNTYHFDHLVGQDNYVLFFKLSRELFDSLFMDHLEESPAKAFIVKAVLGQRNSHQLIQFSPKNNHLIIQRIVQKIVSEIDQKRSGWSYIVKGYFIRLLHILSFSYINHLSTFDKKRFNQMLFDEIALYIDLHYRQVTIKDLMATYHYNEDYYNRLIKKHTGLTFKQYVQKVRLKVAKEKLSQTDQTVSQIAFDVGYKNKGYFYKLFESEEGMTPKGYRQVHYHKHLK